MFPQGTLGSGLSRIAISQGTTRIRFPAPGEISPRAASKPKSDVTHTSTTFGFAYANDLARESMFGKGSVRFPAGSILVREKLNTPAAAIPDALVVMIKREKGFNRRANDWEFLTVTGDMKTIRKREKEGECQQCHASEAGNDFVFRYPAP